MIFRIPNYMKKPFSPELRTLFFLFSSSLIISCSEPDKKAQLETLRQKHEEISKQILALEAELGPDPAASSGKVMDVLVTPIQPTHFVHYIDVQGSVEAEEEVEVRPTMAGTVTRILVKEGDQVRQGQLLAETDNEIYLKQLNALKPQQDLANDLFERQQRLWDQKVGSEVQYLQAKTQKESIQRQIETLEEQVEMTRIKSPINGTVDMVSLKIGQMASAAIMTPAFRIVNLSSLKVVSNMAESNSGKIRTGNKVILSFPDLELDVESQITFAARTIDPLTRTFEAQASLVNNPSFRPNMIAVMRVVDYESKAALCVPVNLVQSSNNESFVYVAQTSPEGRKTAHRRAITTGMTYGNTTEITSGLLEGDLLITTGYTDLTEGMQLNY